MQKNKIIADELRIEIPPFLSDLLSKLQKGINVFNELKVDKAVGNLFFLKKSCAAMDWEHIVKMILETINSLENPDVEPGMKKNTLTSIKSCLLNLREDNMKKVCEILIRNMEILKFTEGFMPIKHSGYLVEKLIDAVGKNDLAKVQELISAGADIHGFYKNNSALSYALFHNYIDIAKVIISSKNFRVNKPISESSTALIMASYHGLPEITELLLKIKDIDINKKDKNGSSALSWASYLGKKDIVRKLLNCKGLDITIKLNNGNTLLTWAAGYEDTADIVKKILSLNKIDINTKNEAGYTALGTARRWNYEKIEKVLSSVPGIE